MLRFISFSVIVGIVIGLLILNIALTVSWGKSNSNISQTIFNEGVYCINLGNN